MFIFASSVPWLDQYATLSEKLFIGVTMALLGVTIVVIVLALISVFVSLMSRVINSGGKKAAGGPKSKTEPAQAVQTEQPAADPAAAADDTDRQELVAVLTAAVTAYLADSAPRSSAGFIIRRVRRV